MRAPWRHRAAIALSGSLVAVLAALAASSPARENAHTPVDKLRCFGAASRDPVHPCHDRRLRYSVVPTPATAAITPNAPCTYVAAQPIQVCAFGAHPDEARGTFALVGDSHAQHWRAAFRTVADAHSWRGISLTLTSCPFAQIARQLPAAQARACAQWVGQVPQWLAAHPEVSTIFVVGQSGARVVVPAGHSRVSYMANGYVAAFKSLPASVKHIVVVRDTPTMPFNVFDCVEHAKHHHQPPGSACEVPRANALLTDPAVVAAQRMHSGRVQVIDMTHYVCGQKACYPVIGGALVYKDVTHLTRVFATSLGPFLLRHVNQLVTAGGLAIDTP
jgi:SGNH domain (fused to AT3 domains)